MTQLPSFLIRFTQLYTGRVFVGLSHGNGIRNYLCSLNQGLKFSFANGLPIQPGSSFHSSVGLCRKLDCNSSPPRKIPTKKWGRWVPFLTPYAKYKDNYTTEEVPCHMSGGRGPNGRIWNHRRGSGLRHTFRLVDFNRARPGTPPGQPIMEKIEKIVDDKWNRSAHLALVAGGEHKRWIVATHGLQEGAVLKTTLEICKTPVRPVEGDTYPLGSLPIGTQVNCIEKYPGSGASFARAAGTSALLVRKLDGSATAEGTDTGSCVVRLPSKREVSVNAQCLATVGRVSNIEHDKFQYGSPNCKRWYGIRPKSGKWHRKTGRHGRKIKPIKPLRVYDKPPPPRPSVYRFTLGK